MWEGREREREREREGEREVREGEREREREREREKRVRRFECRNEQCCEPLLRTISASLPNLGRPIWSNLMFFLSCRKP